MQETAHTGVLREIVGRADLDAFAERVLDSFWDTPELQRLRPPHGELQAWVRWNIELVTRWLIEGRGPTEAELEVFRDQARARAAAGTPPDLVPANFRRAARFAWAALLEGARESERPALLDSADLLFEYVDRVSRIFSDVYESAPLDSEEQSARALLDRIGRGELPRAEDRRLAENLSFDLDRAAHPFVIAIHAGTAQDHALLAERLRAHRAMAASEGRRVTGLVLDKIPPAAIGDERTAVIAIGPAAIRQERGSSLDELRLVAEAALARGHSGLVSAEELLPELLLLSSQPVARRIRARVYGPLEESQPELARTLDVLIEHEFERAATAAAIPVHRNTLLDRVNRITELTGVDLTTAGGRALAWLAWLERRIRI